MTRETRYIKVPGLEVRQLEDGSPVISGLGIVYNRLSEDLGGFYEQVAPAATAQTLSQSRNVFAAFNHDENYILGRVSAGTMTLTNRADGVQYDITPSTVSPLAIHATECVRRGDVSGSSFTFVVKAPSEWEEMADGRVVRTLTQIQVFEMGPVVSPAYLDTTSGVRSAYSDLAESRGLDLREVEQAAKEGALAQVVRAEKRLTEQRETQSNLVCRTCGTLTTAPGTCDGCAAPVCADCQDSCAACDASMCQDCNNGRCVRCGAFVAQRSNDAGTVPGAADEPREHSTPLLYIARARLAMHRPM